MDPQQLPKTSKFYSRSKKCDIEKTLGGGYHPPGSPKVKTILTMRLGTFITVVNSCPQLFDGDGYI